MNTFFFYISCTSKFFLLLVLLAQFLLLYVSFSTSSTFSLYNLYNFRKILQLTMLLIFWDVTWIERIYVTGSEKTAHFAHIMIFQYKCF